MLKFEEFFIGWVKKWWLEKGIERYIRVGVIFGLNRVIVVKVFRSLFCIIVVWIDFFLIWIYVIVVRGGGCYEGF